MSAPNTKDAPRDKRLAHGFTFALMLAVTFSIPLLRGWPWVWLAPLIGYFLVVGCVRPLRQSLTWLRTGRTNWGTVGVTVACCVATATVLVGFHGWMKPDVSSYRDSLPLELFGGIVPAGIVFIILNASMEEAVFRGVVFDGLESQWGRWFTVVATTVLFGIGHLKGYPPGIVGVALATVFGIGTGLLRLWTGGLLASLVVHLVADTTIYCLLVAKELS